MGFGTFSKMVSNLPAQAVLNAVELEGKMLEDDIEQHRFKMDGDAFSILSFRQFVQMAGTGNVVRCAKPLPPDHVEFYKETIVRLVQAGELPKAAMDQFDYAFKL
jgi:hypothetical protein